MDDITIDFIEENFSVNFTDETFSIEYQAEQGPAGPPGVDGPAGDGVGVQGEVPIGTIDGVNTIYALAHTPSNGVRIYLNGMRLKEDTDYTRSSNILTFVSPPVPGDLILVDYNF